MPIACFRPRKNRRHNRELRGAGDLIAAARSRPMGEGSITAIRVPRRLEHLGQIGHQRSGTGGQAGQRLLVDVDLDQVDDPVLGAEVRGLHGLEKEVLRRREAIRGCDRDGGLKEPGLGQPHLNPGTGSGSFSPRGPRAATAGACAPGTASGDSPSHSWRSRAISRRPSGVVATTLMAICC